MIPAVATMLFFAITPVFANRAAHLLGPLAGNFWRLLVATLLLGIWAHVFGGGLAGGARNWFLLGGVVGFGIGGIAMFQSLPRLGSSLSTLIVQCASALTAAAIEWTWLGTRLSLVQIGCVALTLSGVTIGLLPRSLPRIAPERFAAGLAWALVSALGQGAGAVLSRKAFMTAAALHEKIDPGTAAYQRVLGGLFVGLAALVLASKKAGPIKVREASAWVGGNALTGPVLGVTCYQWALRSTPAGIVQPIVAVAPLLTIPFSVAVEGAAQPRWSYYFGAILAIAGATGLLLYH